MTHSVLTLLKRGKASLPGVNTQALIGQPSPNLGERVNVRAQDHIPLKGFQVRYIRVLTLKLRNFLNFF